MTYIKTYTGILFDLATFDQSKLDIRDIAHALSMQCRFNGHCKKFYSVAEHCVRASWLVGHGATSHALMHDASEAYVGDVVSPLKRMLPTYIEKEDILIDLIYDKYCVVPNTQEVLDAVKGIDRFMVELELKELWDDQTHYGWEPARAEREYLSQFERLQYQGLIKVQ